MLRCSFQGKRNVSAVSDWVLTKFETSTKVNQVIHHEDKVDKPFEEKFHEIIHSLSLQIVFDWTPSYTWRGTQRSFPMPMVTNVYLTKEDEKNEKVCKNRIPLKSHLAMLRFGGLKRNGMANNC